jgi:hypothetical protein
MESILQSIRKKQICHPHVDIAPPKVTARHPRPIRPWDFPPPGAGGNGAMSAVNTTGTVKKRIQATVSAFQSFKSYV